MKYNCAQVVSLAPDYIGFIFYRQSPRYWEGKLPDIPKHMGRVGVFVNADITIILETLTQYGLTAIQLHGDETPQFCRELRQEILQKHTEKIEIWKVFGITSTFHCSEVLPYEEVVDKYLFDTKGDHRGGNGVAFNWSVLKAYPSQKPFIISGGIGPEHLGRIHKINRSNLPVHAVDVNSRFEDEPGRKNTAILKKFIDDL
ncbi:MAG: phosphoribosylanthranilate isomerase [Altibacter sp.]|nr:phosphoribosylanthranilate isomerase [Altibacter sp.]